MACVLLAEVVALSLVAWSASTGPAEGIAVRADEAALRVADQSAVTSTVTVDWIVVPGPSWVLIQADYGTGTQGATIGMAHVNAGETVNLPIALETTTLPRTAVVTLIADRGKIGAFEYTGSMSSGGMGGTSSASASADKPYVADGAIVSMPFTIEPLSFKVASGGAVLGGAERASDGSTVTVSGIFAPARSWVSVSLVATSGVLGEVLGVAPLLPGDSPTTTVRLSAAVGKTAPLVATLHADLGLPGQFEYSPTDVGNSPDQPYIAGTKTVRIPIPPAR